MTEADDVEAIRELIARQFASLGWTPERPADWDAFAADFLPEATLFPAGRPLKPTDVPGFVERMKGLAQSSLASFDETFLGAEIRVFGTVAVALAACALRENGDPPQRQVEAILLVRVDGAWRIAAQSWDGERPGQPIPSDLTG